MPCVFKTQTFKPCKCECKWRCQCLIPRKRKLGPPFNTGLDRDVIIGLHPKFYTHNLDSPIVGTYDLPPLKSKTISIDWDRELVAEEFSANRRGISKKNESQAICGPGTHDIVQWPDNILEKPCKTIRKDVGFGTVPLFGDSFPSTNPGPGYTRKNPYHYIDKRRREGFSNVPSFEYDGLKPRFCTISKKWSLPCNIYNVKHPNTLQASLNKTTGKRGPYDLFTGPRDASTIRSYFATEKIEDRGDWPRSLPNELDKLLHKSNYFKGRWTTCPRFPKVSGTRMVLQDLALCYKDPSHPGPGHYDPKSPRKPKNRKNYPFDMNVEFIRPVVMWDLRPGPGRYKIKETRRIKGNGWTFVFKSKLPRTDFIFIPAYNAF